MPNVGDVVVPVVLDAGFENAIEGLADFASATEADEIGSSAAADREALESEDALIQSGQAAVGLSVAEIEGSEEKESEGSEARADEALGDFEGVFASVTLGATGPQAVMGSIAATTEGNTADLPAMDLTAQSVEVAQAQPWMRPMMGWSSRSRRIPSCTARSRN